MDFEHSMATTAGRRLRPVRIAPIDTVVRVEADGSVYMESPTRLGPYPTRITDRLEYWADRVPDRIFLAERGGTDGGRQRVADAWRTLTYGETRTQVRSLAQALLDRGLSSQQPVAILSGNSIDHALLALACMYAGVLYAPISPAYSLQAREYGALGHVFDLLRPRLVFAADLRAYERALRSVLRPDIEVVASSPGSLAAVPFADLLDTAATSDVDAACRSVGPDTIAKILFTSGIDWTSQGGHQHAAHAVRESGDDPQRSRVSGR